MTPPTHLEQTLARDIERIRGRVADMAALDDPCRDEFSIAIDPVTTMRIEDVLRGLRRTMTIVLVTNLVLSAAARSPAGRDHLGSSGRVPHPARRGGDLDGTFRPPHPSAPVDGS